VPALATATLLVELHEFAAPGVEAQLTTRFRSTHRATLIEATPRRLEDYRDRLEGLNAADASTALDEGRPRGMKWALMVP
jgi:hypothetical protein